MGSDYPEILSGRAERHLRSQGGVYVLGKRDSGYLHGPTSGQRDGGDRDQGRRGNYHRNYNRQDDSLHAVLCLLQAKSH